MIECAGNKPTTHGFDALVKRSVKNDWVDLHKIRIALKSALDVIEYLDEEYEPQKEKILLGLAELEMFDAILFETTKSAEPTTPELFSDGSEVEE